MTENQDTQGAASEREGLRSRLRFERLPAAYCHPERLATLLPESLREGMGERLQGSARLRPRLSTLLTRRFDLTACAADDLTSARGRFAQREGVALTHALRGIGAVWHARTLSRIVLKAPLRRLVDWLGQDNHRRALHLRDLGVDVDDLPSAAPEQPDVETLFGLIERDAVIALNAWCRCQPAALAGRVRLKLPPGPHADGEPPALHRERGPIIVDRLIASLETEGHQRHG